MGDRRIFIPQDTGVVNTDNFDIVTYSGNASTQTISSLNFQPDFIWMKRRSSSQEHALVNSVSGTQRNLYSDLTNQEVTTTNGVSSFNSDGWTMGGNGLMNSNYQSATYVAWTWKAGGAATTITSECSGVSSATRSANPNAGFSIVRSTANSASQDLAHGLNSPPELHITKRTSSSSDWIVYNTVATGKGRGFLNLTNVFDNFGVPTYDSTLVNDLNWASGDTSVNYFFHSVDGYQKVGTYTGASGDITVTTGFKPRFVMLKNASVAARNWEIHDAVRFPTIYNENGQSKRLRANTSAAEANFSNSPIFFTNTGFVLDSSVTANAYGDYDTNGENYIYLAIA